MRNYIVKIFRLVEQTQNVEVTATSESHAIEEACGTNENNWKNLRGNTPYVDNPDTDVHVLPEPDYWKIHRYEDTWSLILVSGESGDHLKSHDGYHSQLGAAMALVNVIEGKKP